MEIVMDMTGCGPIEAATALAEHKEIWRAVDALLPTPVVAGAKYIPARPHVDSGLTPEQQERCTKGRWLQDQVNAVFSVAHSTSQTQPSQRALEGQGLLLQAEPPVQVTPGVQSQSTISSPPDTGAKIPLPSPQSEPPLQTPA